MRQKNYTHLIFITSNYEEGVRYGLHFAVSKKNSNEITSLMNKYSKKDNVALYTVITSDESIESVRNKEPFFAEVNFIDGSESLSSGKFEKKFNNQLDAIDFALLILTNIQCTYFDLLIYIYHCYCEYLLKYNELLFLDKLSIDVKKKFKGFQIKSLSEYFEKITEIDYEKLFKNFSYEKEVERLPKLKINQIDVAYSKFFNVENGILQMTRFIEIFEKLRGYTLKQLYKEIVDNNPVIKLSDKKSKFITSKCIRKYYKSHFKR